MSDSQSPPTSNTDATATATALPTNQFGIVRNPEGTYTRLFQVPCTAATPDDDGHSPVLSKDIPVNPKNQTWIRIFLPRRLIDSSFDKKLPVVFYFHGGGFVFMSPASSMIHDFCVKMAAQLLVVVVSVEYRLAPEHRLPAAYDDAVEALLCIKNTKEIWLSEYADLSNCFVMGSSAGGNIAYHAGLRAAEIVDDLEPLNIRGLILQQPFFGGSGRTESDLRLGNGPVLTLSGSDHMWELSLPVDADRDHEYCNPTVGGGSEKLGRVRVLGWRVLICGVYGDHLIDRQMDLARMLKEKGVRTEVYFEEGYHGMEIMEPSKAEGLFGALVNFIS